MFILYLRLSYVLDCYTFLELRAFPHSPLACFSLQEQLLRSPMKSEDAGVEADDNAEADAKADAEADAKADAESRMQEIRESLMSWLDSTGTENQVKCLEDTLPRTIFVWVFNSFLTHAKCGYH